MCELLGMSANVPTDIVFSFTGLMQRGGGTGPHRDGWGIAFYEGRGVRLFQDPLASVDSEVARLVQRFPIKSETVIGHIRQANVGKVGLSKHPPLHPRTRWALLDLRAQWPTGRLPAQARFLPPGRRDRQRGGLLRPAEPRAPGFPRAGAGGGAVAGADLGL